MSDERRDFYTHVALNITVIVLVLLSMHYQLRRMVWRLDALLSVEQARYLIESVEHSRPAAQAAPVHSSPDVPPSRKAHSRESTAE